MRNIIYCFVLLVLIMGVVAIACACFSSFSTSKTCVLCVREYGVLQKKFLGVTYQNTEKLRSKGFENMIGNHAHAYKRGGFCRRTGGIIACGKTREEAIFGKRKNILNFSFALAQQYEDKMPAINTVEIMDKWFPITLTNKEEVDDPMVYVYARDFSNALHDVKSKSEWKALVQKMQNKKLKATVSITEIES